MLKKTIVKRQRRIAKRGNICRQWSSVKRPSGKDHPSNVIRHWLTNRHTQDRDRIPT
jgi:hypothetical protein